MKKIILIAISLLAVIAVFYMYFISNQKVAAHAHHQPRAVPENMPLPSLSLSVLKDTMSGFNLILELQNYQMGMPSDSVQSAAQLNNGVLQGHAHLWINGVKVQRIYGRFIHLPKPLFKSGYNKIRVTLNSHKHQNWTIAGEIIASEITVVDDESGAGHTGH